MAIVQCRQDRQIELNMAGMFPELQVLQDHTANLTSVIATNPALLGPHLVQYGFAVRAMVDGIVHVLGLPNDQKAGQLLNLVDAKIRNAVTKENARKYFNNFLLIIANDMGHSDIAESLAAALKSKDPSYASPLQGGHAPLTNSPGNQQPSATSADLNRVIDNKHYGQIADGMREWEGSIADELGLNEADVAAIKGKHPFNLKLQTREALARWKQKNGNNATYSKLIGVFERADYQQFADNVKRLATGGNETVTVAAASSKANIASKHVSLTISPQTNIGNNDVIEMHEPSGEGRVDIDHGGIKELCWCVSPILEQTTNSGQRSVNIGRQMSLATLQYNNLWDLDELHVKFLDEIPSGWAFCDGGMNLDSIMNLATQWNKKGKHIPQIKRVGYGAPAHIRVRFTSTEVSRSYVGVLAQDKHGQPTMWLNLSTGGDEYKKHLVVHEFGHALGLDHEHQRGDLWKLIKPYVNESAMKTDPYIKHAYAAYIADPTFEAHGREQSEYDPKSVMHYWFRSCWLKDDYNTEEKVQNADISESERAALLGILQRSKGTLVTEPSQTDLDFLDDRYREKKESKEKETDEGIGTHTDGPPVEEAPVQLPLADHEAGTPKPKPTPVDGPPQLQPPKDKPVQQSPAEKGLAPHEEKMLLWIRFLLGICYNVGKQLVDTCHNGGKNLVIAILGGLCAILIVIVSRYWTNT